MRSEWRVTGKLNPWFLLFSINDCPRHPILNWQVFYINICYISIFLPDTYWFSQLQTGLEVISAARRRRTFNLSSPTVHWQPKVCFLWISHGQFLTIFYLLRLRVITLKIDRKWFLSPGSSADRVGIINQPPTVIFLPVFSWHFWSTSNYRLRVLLNRPKMVLAASRHPRPNLTTPIDNHSWVSCLCCVDISNLYLTMNELWRSGNRP
jgi:hypothetical protein